MTPGMSQLMHEWLDKRGIDFDPDEAESLCSVMLGLEDDNLDICVSYVYAFEKEELNEEEFVAALCELTGKPPEELVEAIKNREVPDASKEEAASAVEPGGTEGNADVDEIRPGERDKPSDMEPTAH